MSKIYKEQSATTRTIRSELQKKNEEMMITLKLEGFPKDLIEELKFKEENQLNLPSNLFNDLLVQAIKVIFSNSERIHADIFVSIIKDLSSIDIEEICEAYDSIKERIGSYSEKIMDVIITNMESLYYFHDDNVFTEMIFDLCLELDLDPQEYGFSREVGDCTCGHDKLESKNQEARRIDDKN